MKSRRSDIHRRKKKSFLRYGVGIIAVVIILLAAGYIWQKQNEASTAAVPSPIAAENKQNDQQIEYSTAASQNTDPAATAPPAIEENYDLVLIGSEVEGVLMAKAAYDQGLKVLILDPREHPGGQLIQGQMQVLDEPNTNKKKSLVQGEMKKLYNAYNTGTIRKESDFIKYYDSLIRDIPLKNGITIKQIQQDNHAGTAAHAASNMKSIISLTYAEQDGTEHTISAEYWVENTDYAALSSQLDTTRIPGVESIFGSGDQPQHMAATYMLKFKGVDWLALHSATLRDYPLTRLEEKYGTNTYVDYDFGTGFNKITDKLQLSDPQLKFRGINSTYQKDGEVIINALLIYDVDPADPESVRKAIDKGKAAAPQVLEFLRNNIPGYEHAELNGFPEYLYIRDYDRFETDYVLQYEDAINNRMFWDNVSIGGYPLDIQGTPNVPTGKGYGKPDYYGIPLRSFELKSYDNVLVAGKNIGASIKAYGSARITPTTALAAEVIGIILGHEKGEKKLRDLTEADFKTIHAYLKKDYNISLD